MSFHELLISFLGGTKLYSVTFKELSSSSQRVVSQLKLSSVEQCQAVLSSVVEWLRHHAYDQHGLGSKVIHAILLYPWERHFTTLSPAW